ncbi:RNA polymerase sigma factor [Hymenobacter sp. B1770]|uniref:RNA polymerase sigma factor n=1 Tax=Hymenobacter sp. B1770 TaxID=1718788 RepID=UPI003CEB8237
MHPQSALPSSAPTPEETELVQRLLARDERALGILHARYAASLLAVIRRLVRDEALAEDLLQEGLCKVWTGLASYDASRGRLFTWMARVCSNHAIDALRSQHHRFQKRTTPLETSVAQHAADPGSFNPEHLGVRTLLEDLKPQQREVMDLVYFGGWTYAQAAEQLGIPVNTAKTRARAALLVLARRAR